LTVVLDDGTYDAIVVDAREIEGEAGDAVVLELTITAGPHKGEIVTVHAEHLALTAIDVLGLPGDLIVTDGAPRLVLQR
jgi:hypothetical protein